MSSISDRDLAFASGLFCDEVWALGNSITNGSAATSAANRYANRIASALGATLYNASEGGENVASMCYQLLPGYTHARASSGFSGSPAAITSDMLTLIEGDYNGARDFGNVEAYQKHHLYTTRALAAWASVLDANKKTGQSESVTKTGTWTDDTRFGGELAVKSSTANDYVEFEAQGNSVYVFIVQEAASADPYVSGTSGRPGSGGSTFSIAVDGVTRLAAESNYQAYGNRPAYQNSNPFGTPVAEESVWCYRFDALGDTRHTVRVTVNTIGATSAVTFLAGFGSSDVKYAHSSGPWALLATMVTPLVAGGANLTTESLINSAMAAFRGNVRTVAQELQSDGLHCLLADTAAYYDRATASGDNVHPNDTGHQQIASAHLDAIYRSPKLDQAPASNVKFAELAGTNVFTGSNNFGGTTGATTNGTICVGVSSANAKASLHVARTVGSWTPIAGTAFIVESAGDASASALMQIISGTSGTAFLLMGDTAGPSTGFLAYNNATDTMSIRTALGERFAIDAQSADFNVPVRIPSYAVASLPTSGITAGCTAYATNGRKSGEGVGSGTGVPVWHDGTNWRTFYDNTIAAA